MLEFSGKDNDSTSGPYRGTHTEITSSSITHSINQINQLNQPNQPINQINQVKSTNQPKKQTNQSMHPFINQSLFVTFFFPHGGDPHPLNLFLGKPPRPPTLGRGWHTPDISR